MNRGSASCKFASKDSEHKRKTLYHCNGSLNWFLMRNTNTQKITREALNWHFRKGYLGGQKYTSDTRVFLELDRRHVGENKYLLSLMYLNWKNIPASNVFKIQFISEKIRSFYGEKLQITSVISHNSKSKIKHVWLVHRSLDCSNLNFTSKQTNKRAKISDKQYLLVLLTNNKSTAHGY
jgi:hypothetical protein